jgi:hypothetical protein
MIASRCRSGSLRSASTTADRSSSTIAPCSALGTSERSWWAFLSTTVRWRSTDRALFITAWRR